jgi:hypothetical protein
MFVVMKITTTIDQEFKIRIQSVSGQVDIGGLKSYIDKIFKNRELFPDMKAIWDLRDADLSKMVSEDVQKLRDVVVGKWGMDERRRAALIVSRDIEFGLSRMLEMLLGEKISGKVMIFRDYDKAMNWIKNESSD